MRMASVFHRGIMLLLMHSMACAKELVTATLRDTTGKSVGTVGVVMYAESSIFKIDLWDVPPGWHAVHLHQKADCSDPEEGFKKSGGHINPEQKTHGIGSEGGFHRGDLANVYAVEAAEGVRQVQVEQLVPWVSQTEPLGEVAFIVHAQRDDYETDPTGNAGNRIACAILRLGSDKKASNVSDSTDRS